MNLVALPAFTDNYIWMLHNGYEALVVDPDEAGSVLHARSAQQLALAGILVTHHHADHVGSAGALRAHLQGPVSNLRFAHAIETANDAAIAPAARARGAASADGTAVFIAPRAWETRFR